VLKIYIQNFITFSDKLAGVISALWSLQKITDCRDSESYRLPWIDHDKIDRATELWA